MTTTESCPVWQSLMTEAYASFDDSKPYELWVFGLTGPQRVAVLLGNLNYQVENGGFRQWVGNGYAEAGNETIDALRLVGGDKAMALAGKLAELLRHVRRDPKARTMLHNPWERDGDDTDCPGEVMADSMDDWFYRYIQPELMPAVEAFLKQRQ